MANTSDIRNGLCIDFNDDIYSIIEFQHVKPGKGNAFVRTRLKSFLSGKIIDHTFPAGHKINTVRVERRACQFLYNDESGYHFMDTESYEQVDIQEDLIDNAKFLKEGIMVEVLFHSEKEMPLSIDLPQYIELKITYTEPGLKGDTATNTLKPATTETGAEIRVPLFVNEGDVVIIDSASGSYIKRA